jgi:hypothetical protein
VTVCWTALAAVLTAILGGATTLPFIGPIAMTYAILVAIAVNVLVGVPVTLFLFSSRTRWPEVAAIGFAVGTVPFVVLHLLLISTQRGPLRENPLLTQFTAAGAACGTVTALSFWWLRGRQLHEKR